MTVNVSTNNSTQLTEDRTNGHLLFVASQTRQWERNLHFDIATARKPFAEHTLHTTKLMRTKIVSMKTWKCQLNSSATIRHSPFGSCKSNVIIVSSPHQHHTCIENMRAHSPKEKKIGRTNKRINLLNKLRTHIVSLRSSVVCVCQRDTQCACETRTRSHKLDTGVEWILRWERIENGP